MAGGCGEDEDGNNHLLHHHLMDRSLQSPLHHHQCNSRPSLLSPQAHCVGVNKCGDIEEEQNDNGNDVWSDGYCPCLRPVQLPNTGILLKEVFDSPVPSNLGCHQLIPLSSADNLLPLSEMSTSSTSYSIKSAPHCTSADSIFNNSKRPHPHSSSSSSRHRRHNYGYHRNQQQRSDCRISQHAGDDLPMTTKRPSISTQQQFYSRRCSVDGTTLRCKCDDNHHTDRCHSGSFVQQCGCRCRCKSNQNGCCFCNSTTAYTHRNATTQNDSNNNLFSCTTSRYCKISLHPCNKCKCSRKSTEILCKNSGNDATLSSTTTCTFPGLHSKKDEHQSSQLDMKRSPTLQRSLIRDASDHIQTYLGSCPSSSYVNSEVAIETDTDNRPRCDCGFYHHYCCNSNITCVKCYSSKLIGNCVSCDKTPATSSSPPFNFDEAKQRCSNCIKVDHQIPNTDVTSHDPLLRNTVNTPKSTLIKTRSLPRSTTWTGMSHLMDWVTSWRFSRRRSDRFGNSWRRWNSLSLILLFVFKMATLTFVQADQGKCRRGSRLSFNPKLTF